VTGEASWLAQIERVCRETPPRLVHLGRCQAESAWRCVRQSPNASWALPAALMATLLVGALPAHADSPIAKGEFQVNTYTTDDQWLESIAMDADGDFVVTWEGQGQGDYGGVYARRYQSDGTAAGDQFRVNTYTTSYQFFSSVAMDDSGDFVIAWSGYGQGHSHSDVYAKCYDRDGNVAKSEFPVNVHLTGDQDNPSVAIDADGDFVIAWHSDPQEGPGGYYGVYARGYNQDCTPRDLQEFHVNTYTTSNQRHPEVAMDGSGDFVIVWEGTGPGDADGVFARRYQGDGTAQDPQEFRVNTYTTHLQSSPAVAMDVDGDFVVAWDSASQEGVPYDQGVYARRYETDGTPLDTPEFRVNVLTTDGQVLASVGTDASGDFVIAWESEYQDGDEEGVFARRYRSDGTPLEASEFRVNLYTIGGQTVPQVAMDADGDFVVAWASYQDGDGAAVYAQRYTVPKAVYLPTVLKSG
jgi:hypothetical protein